MGELIKRFEVHPVMISKWKQKFIEHGAEVFEKKKIIYHRNINRAIRILRFSLSDTKAIKKLNTIKVLAYYGLKQKQ